MVKREVDIARPVVEWLESWDWDVYQEVELFAQSSRADIVAKHGKKVWVIEVKQSLSIEVMAQAYGWVRASSKGCVSR